MRLSDPRRVYLRLHGRVSEAYLIGKTVAERFNYNYNDWEIDEIRDQARGLAREADTVLVVFNNNARDYAPVAAEKLRRKLEQISKRPESERV